MLSVTILATLQSAQSLVLLLPQLQTTQNVEAAPMFHKASASSLAHRHQCHPQAECQAWVQPRAAVVEVALATSKCHRQPSVLHLVAGMRLLLLLFLLRRP